MKKEAGYYTLVDLFTKGFQAITVLCLAKLFSKDDFGYFSILYAFFQLFTSIMIGGVLEHVISKLANHEYPSTESNAILVALKMLAVRLLYLFPMSCVALVIFLYVNRDATSFEYCFWIIVSAIAGTLNGIQNIHIGILTCVGEHRRSIILRAKVIILQCTLGLFIALTAKNIQLYLIALALVPAIFCVRPISKVCVCARGCGEIKFRGAVNYFFFNALLNWMPWYGLTIMVGLFLGEGASAEYSLIMNIVSVMLLVAGGVSQAILPMQISLGLEQLSSKIRKALSIQLVLLVLMAGALISLYYISIDFGLLNENYSGIQFKLLICLISIVISAGYFLSVAMYSLNNRGLELFNISIFALLASILLGIITFNIVMEYFPYVFFSSFFVLRGLVVCVRSGYDWRAIFMLHPKLI